MSNASLTAGPECARLPRRSLGGGRSRAQQPPITERIQSVQHLPEYVRLLRPKDGRTQSSPQTVVTDALPP